MAQFYLSAFADEAADDLEGQIRALKRNGFTHLEPRSIEGGIMKKTDEELYAIRKRLDEEEIGISALGSPIGKYDIHQDFEPHLASFRRAIQICRILGTNRMRMFSFFVKPEELSACRDEVLRRMRIMLEEANDAGILLCHENESEIYGQNPEEVADLLSSLPGLYGVFDAANFVRNGQDPVRGFDVTLPRLEYLHIKDASSEGDCPIMPVGLGDGHYEEILRRVDEATDRPVFLTLEPHLRIFRIYQKIDSRKLSTGMQFDDSDEAFDCAAKHLKDMLTKLGFRKEGLVWKK